MTRLLPAAACVFAAACASSDPSSVPPAPFEDETQVLPLDYDADASRELARWLRENCDEDLAYRMPVSASNVRARQARFTPSALTDGDETTYWTTDELVTTAHVTVELGTPTDFDHVVLEEHVELGRRVEGWSLSVRSGEAWTEVARGVAIGAERTVSFPTVRAEAVRLSIESADACPVIDSFEVYAAPEGATGPSRS